MNVILFILYTITNFFSVFFSFFIKKICIGNQENGKSLVFTLIFLISMLVEIFAIISLPLTILIILSIFY